MKEGGQNARSLHNNPNFTMNIRKTLIATALTAVLLPGAALADSDSQETIFDAAKGGEARLMQIISGGISIDTPDSDGETALMKAADKGMPGAVSLLIKHGADVNRRDEDGETALMFAADEGHTSVVEILIKAGADINAVNKDGESALMMAEDEGHDDTAATLRAAGAKK